MLLITPLVSKKPGGATDESAQQLLLRFGTKAPRSVLMQPFIWILLGNAAVIALSIGDTIRVSSPSGINKTTVRLACIDAPEISQAPYGNDARQALQGELAIGAEVSLRTKATDRYGRTVAEVLKGTTNINQALVGAGAAFVYWQYIEGCDLETYSRLENEVRLKSLGVWEVPGGIQRPWDYRRGSKSFNAGAISLFYPSCKQLYCLFSDS